MKLLQRGLRLDRISMQLARENLVLTARARRGRLFPRMLEIALVDTFTRTARNTLAKAFLELCASSLGARAATTLAPKLVDHHDLLIFALARRDNPEPRAALAAITSAGSKLAARDLAYIRFHLKDIPGHSSLCDPSHHQALTRHALGQNPGTVRLLTWSERQFQRFLKQKA